MIYLNQKFPNLNGVDTISEEIEPHLKFKYLSLFSITFLILLPAAYASSIAPYNIEVTHDYVKATAVCSCGLNDYIHHTKSFYNYCPHCDSYGTLIFNPKGVPEGEWTCTKCSSDYCAADGREKMPNTPYCLTPYKSPEVQAQEGATIRVKRVMTHLDMYKNKNFLGSG